MLLNLLLSKTLQRTEVLTLLVKKARPLGGVRPWGCKGVGAAPARGGAEGHHHGTEDGIERVYLYLRACEDEGKNCMFDVDCTTASVLHVVYTIAYLNWTTHIYERSVFDMHLVRRVGNDIYRNLAAHYHNGN